MAIDTTETGPIYGVPLIDVLPLDGGMLQAMASRDDLEQVSRINTRVAAAYEVLLEHYRRACHERDRLRQLADYLDDPKILLKIPRPIRLRVSELLHGSEPDGDQNDRDQA